MSNVKPAQMSNQIQNSNEQKYDLPEKTRVFGEAIIEFVKKLPKNDINKPLIG